MDEQQEMTIESSLSIGEKCRVTVSKRKMAEALGFNVIDAKGTPITFTFVRALSEDEARERFAGELNQQLMAQQSQIDVLAAQLAELRNGVKAPAEDTKPAGHKVESYIADDGYAAIGTIMSLTDKTEYEVRRDHKKRKMTDVEKRMPEFEKKNYKFLFSDELIQKEGKRSRKLGNLGKGKDVVIDASIDYPNEWVRRLQQMFPNKGIDRGDIKRMQRNGDLVRVDRATETEQKIARNLDGRIKLYKLVRNPFLNGAAPAEQAQTL